MDKIFIVEDDSIIAGAIKRHIEQWGCEVRCAENFQNVLQEFVSFDPQIVLLDISLPFFNGFHWCTQIRNISKVPIVFISSASDNMNIVMAMNMGGDDFITKPFDLTVLTAKVQAILRRTYDFRLSSNLIEHNGVIFNISDASLSFHNDKLELTKNECKIIQLLLERCGSIVSRDTLMIKLWESDSFVDDNTLSVNVTRLRRKCEAIGLENFIITKKGIGYMVE